MDKYDSLRQAGTNGANYDLDTEDVIAHLQAWDTKYGISLGKVKRDAVMVTFEKLPDDITQLAADVYEFCPDVIDQHFGSFAEMVEMAEESGEGIPEKVQELIEGVDLTSDDYGIELLRRSLARDKRVALWWD